MKKLLTQLECYWYVFSNMMRLTNREMRHNFVHTCLGIICTWMALNFRRRSIVSWVSLLISLSTYHSFPLCACVSAVLFVDSCGPLSCKNSMNNCTSVDGLLFSLVSSVVCESESQCIRKMSCVCTMCINDGLSVMWNSILVVEIQRRTFNGSVSQLKMACGLGNLKNNTTQCII